MGMKKCFGSSPVAGRILSLRTWKIGEGAESGLGGQRLLNNPECLVEALYFFLTRMEKPTDLHPRCQNQLLEGSTACGTFKAGLKDSIEEHHRNIEEEHLSSIHSQMLFAKDRSMLKSIHSERDIQEYYSLLRSWVKVFCISAQTLASFQVRAHDSRAYPVCTKRRRPTFPTPSKLVKSAAIIHYCAMRFFSPLPRDR